ncbi:MAG: hypothetical protein IT438_07825 [Phycisphaerales bacterium]|nr:hypothetical protein [Phycisphaerales bacterium]
MCSVSKDCPHSGHAPVSGRPSHEYPHVGHLLSGPRRRRTRRGAASNPATTAATATIHVQTEPGVSQRQVVIGAPAATTSPKAMNTVSAVRGLGGLSASSTLNARPHSGQLPGPSSPARL